MLHVQQQVCIHQELWYIIYKLQIWSNNYKSSNEIINETSYLHWLKWMWLCQTYDLFAPFRQTFGNETTVRRNNCAFDSFRIHIIVQQCIISAFEIVLFHLKSKQLSTFQITKFLLYWDLRYFQFDHWIKGINTTQKHYSSN